MQPGEADTLSATLASVDTFRQANVDYTGALQSIRFTIERRPNNQYVIALTSNQPMNEPFIDLLVELSWSAGRLVREYTFLLDPPELKSTVSTPAPPVELPRAAPLAQEAPKPAPSTAPAPAVEAVRAPVASTGASTKPAAKSTGEYAVKRGDTLGRIASQNMLPGATLHQMLAAMYRGNPDAFDGKNMNRLRTGRILNLPAAEDVQGVSQNEAVQLVKNQSADYAEYLRSIGAAVVGAPERAEGSRQASGRISAPTTDKPAAKAPATDQLRLSKPDEAKGAGKGAATAKADDLAAKDKALREAQERVALLEKNVQDMQKLLQLKSSAGAQAQSQAELAKAAPAAPAKAETKADAKAEAKGDAGKGAAVPAKAEPAKAEPAKAEPAKAATEAPKAPAPVPDAAKGATPEAVGKPAEPAAPDAAKAAEPAKPAAESPAPDAAKVAPKPAPKAPPPPPPEPPSFIDELLDNELAVGGAGGVVILLAGYAAYAWRKKKKDMSANAAGGEVSSAPVAAVSIASSGMGAESAPPSIESGSSQETAGKSDSEEIDPIAEADVYMAYGRDAQAEEILKEALAKDTSRIPVWLKLLEIYANRKDVKTFESTAMDLQTLTGGQGADWETVKAMGLQLDPGNALYGGSGNADFGSTQVLPGQDTGSADSTVVLGGNVSPTEASGSPLDFDLDLGAAPDQDGAAATVDIDLDLGAPAATDDGAADSGGSALDFDLGLGDDKPAQEEPASDFSPHGTLIIDSTSPAAAEPAPEAADNGATIDFDLGMDNETPPPAVPEAAPVAVEDAGSTMDFNLNLDDLAVDAAPEPTVSVATTDIDLSDISLDLGSESTPPTETMDAKWQEVATKLDLAKAYDEMGDKDGARDLLNEVVQEGDSAQQQQAQSMLDSLG